jgi:hypothetical protein
MMLEGIWLEQVTRDKRDVLRHACFAFSEFASATHTEHLNGGVLLGHRFEDVIADISVCTRDEHLFYFNH